MIVSRRREDAAIVALSLGCTFVAIWPLVAREGVPLFAHDWTWSPYAERSVWTWRLLLSSWSEVGLGEPNSTVSANPLAWLKVALPLLLSGRDSQLVYLGGSLVFAALATYRLTRRNLGVSARLAWLSVPALLASPFVFNKIASGQSSYWAGFAAFVWGLSFALDAFERDDRPTVFAAGACFALASVQLQFFVFAWLAWIVRAAVARRRRAFGLAALGIAASSTLAIPSIWFLALRGALVGARISPPYRSWLAALSATPSDAAATLGYVARYAERAVASDPVILALAHGAAFALVVAAVAGTLASREENAWTLAILGAAGWWWLTGVDGLFGRLREHVFETVVDAGFFREFYHAGALYAPALAALATLGLARLRGRAGPVVVPLGLLLVGALGAQTWSGGLGRVLPFSMAPASTDELARAVGAEPARVLFLPAQQPLRTRGDTIGGNDGLDWIDANHPSLYEYYLPPPVATVAEAVASGDATTARRLLARFGASSVVFRTYVTSGDGPRRGGDRSFVTLGRAFGAATEAAPGTFVFTVPHAPAVDAVEGVVALPADLRAMSAGPGTAYLDEPGRDAAPYAADLFRVSPDPSAGWISRRDVPGLDAATIAASFYGIVTLRAGAAVTLRALPAGDLVVWSAAGGMRRRAGAGRTVRIVAAGPAAVTEVGERPYPTARLDGRARLLARTHDAPWSYRATIRIAGRTALVLRERYDEHWRLEAPPGLAIERHLRADGFANAWIVAGRGRFPVRFAYDWQPATEALLVASLAAFVATLAAARERRRA